MKPTIKPIIIFLLLLFLFSCEKREQRCPQIIPLPQSNAQKEGMFEITSKTQIVVSSQELTPLANLLKAYVKRMSGIELSISNKNSATGNIYLTLRDGLKAEEYKLNVADEIELNASNYNSMALALATLVQSISMSGKKVLVPNMLIADKPDYKYRAVMLDVARMWHPVETIKETIDLLWMYKIPYLLLHLSDNRKVTFPFDRYPKLQHTNADGSRWYYTKQELNDLVEYAKQRGIAIVPEIDLPGHSGQLFTQYPEVFGHVDKKIGKAKYLYVINIAKEEAYEASEYIINELAKTFYTAPYINLGGDEVYLEELKKLPEYKSYCKKHNLQAALNGNANELFCHFINRVHEMIKATGKQTLAWEGFHGTGAGSETICKDINVIVWNTTYNHPDSLRKNGYNIINSTWVPWYLVGAMNLAAPQEKGYNWDVTDWSHWNENNPNIQLDSKEGIMGGQISFWEQNHFKVIPQLKERVPVFSERLWNNKANTDFTDFKNRYEQTNAVYEKLFQPITVNAKNLLNEQDQTFIDIAKFELESSISGTIKFFFSETWKLPEMENVGMEYTKPFSVNKSGVLSTQLFDKNNQPVGFPIQQYFQKIRPAYNYKVFSGAPQHGWTEMPDFTQLPVIREGVSGLMTPERLEKINVELFAKVKKEGHIETRFKGIFNPYALELKGTIEIPENNDYIFRIQTHDGLAELYIDDKAVGIGAEFGNKPEDFTTVLEAGKHTITINYFYKEIQNQLSILYKTDEMETFKPFEELMVPLQ